jgi:acetolactate synthase-1/2/3 large subunit
MVHRRGRARELAGRDSGGADLTGGDERQLDGRRLAAETLLKAGIPCLFVLASSDMGGIAQACSDAGIRVIGCRDERSAGFMAASYGALTRRPGVCLLPQGPGLTNAITGLVQGQKGNWPVVSIAGGAPDSEHGSGALQEIDQIAMLRPGSKWAQAVKSPARIGQSLRRALEVACCPPRGHAHLTIPIDLLETPVSSGLVDHAHQPFREPRVRPAADDVGLAVELIESAERPLLLVGSGAWFADAGESLHAFLDVFELPTFTFDEARGLVADSHKACLGSLAFHLNGATDHVRRADLILSVGLEPDWRVDYLEAPLVAEDALLIQIDSSVESMNRGRNARVAIWSHEEEALRAIAGAGRQSSPRRWQPWLSELQAARSEWLHAREHVGPTSRLHPGSVTRAVGRAVEQFDANVVIDGGHIGKWAKALLTAERPGQINRLKGAWAAIGHGLPSAMIRKLTDPSRPTILITGDGAFGYGVLELETAVTEEIPVVCVVAVDGAWGSVTTSQRSRHGGDAGTLLPQTRFDRLAGALGARGSWVAREEDLDLALASAVASEETHVIAVETETVASPAVYPRSTRYA